MSPFSDPMYARWFRRKQHPDALVRSFADLWFLDEVKWFHYGVFPYESRRKV